MIRSVALVAVLIVALAAPAFVYPVLLMTVLSFIVFACSFNLLLGYAGLLCFGHAMFFGGAAYVTGWVLKTTGVSIELGILAGGLAGAALGWLVGLVAVRRSGIQFAMITFAISQFIYFLLLQAPFTGGEDGMQRIPRTPFLGLVDVTRNSALYYVALGFSVVAVVLFYRVVHSPFGEILKAIRDNETRVESLGFRPERFKLIAFVLSAGMAGIAGGIKATAFQIATLTDVSWTVSGEVILMTLLGGLGTLVGPMVGAVIIILLNDYLSGFGEWSLISQGVIMLAVIIFLRRGVVGEIAAALRRRRRVGADEAAARGQPSEASPAAPNDVQPPST